MYTCFCWISCIQPFLKYTYAHAHRCASAGGGQRKDARTRQATRHDTTPESGEIYGEQMNAHTHRHKHQLKRVQIFIWTRHAVVVSHPFTHSIIISSHLVVVVVAVLIALKWCKAKSNSSIFFLFFLFFVSASWASESYSLSSLWMACPLPVPHWMLFIFALSSTLLFHVFCPNNEK